MIDYKITNGDYVQKYIFWRQITIAGFLGGYSMELMFIGADHDVTGSCHYLRVGEKNILVD